MKRAFNRVVVPYLVFASLWILLSDTLIAAFWPKPETLTEISIAKGLLFVGVTAGLLSGLLRWELVARESIQASLQASERSYRNLFERTNHGVVYLDRQGNITAANPAAVRVLGLDVKAKKEINLEWRTYRSDGSPLPFEELPSTIALRTGQPVHGVMMGFATRPEAKIRWLLVDAIPEFSSNLPQPDHVFSSFIDVTALRETEALLRQSEAHSRLAMEAAKAGTWEWNLETNQNLWSEEVWKLYGLTPAGVEPSYELWRQAIHPADRSATEAAALSAVRNRKPINLEWRVATPDHSERWLLLRGQPVPGPGGQINRYLGVVMDVTDRKLAEQRLRQTEIRFRRLVDQAPIPLCHANKQGSLVYFNDRFKQVFGYDREDLPTLEQWWARAYPDPAYRRTARARWESAVQRAEAAGSDIKPEEYAVTTKDGTVSTVEISGIPMEDGFLAIFVDVNHRRRSGNR